MAEVSRTPNPRVDDREGADESVQSPTCGESDHGTQTSGRYEASKRCIRGLRVGEMGIE